MPAEGERSELAFDGDHFWVYRILGSVKTLADVDKLEPQLLKLDRTGAIVATFRPKNVVSGMTYDGENLWAVSELLEGLVFYTVDLETGEFTRSFSVPTLGFDTNGMAFEPGKFWLLVSEREGR